MSYKLITNRKSPNFGYPDGAHGGNHPQYIVIHWWDDPARKPSYEGVVNWLCRDGGNSSAHDIAEAGRVTHIIDYADAAWHTGNYEANTHSIGVECSPYMTDGDFETVAEHIACLWKQFGKLPLKGHRDIVKTTCPGVWYARLGELAKRAEFYYGEKPAEKPEKAKIAEDGIWGHDTTLATQKKLGVKWNDGKLSEQYAAELDRAILTENIHTGGWEFIGHVGDGSDTVRAIQKMVGAPVDGIVGPDTIKAMQKFLGITADGIMGPATVKAWQKWLNK